MRKELLAGLAALLVSCNPVRFTAEEPIFIKSTHRGVPLTGIIYRDIQIIGSQDYIEREMHSLDRLSQTPFWNFVHAHLTTLRYNPPSKVHLAEGIYDTDEDFKTSEKNQPEAWVDSEKVHEACHVSQHKTKRESWGYNAEKECMLLQNRYLLHIGASDLQIDVKKRLQERYWEKENQGW